MHPFTFKDYIVTEKCLQDYVRFYKIEHINCMYIVIAQLQFCMHLENLDEMYKNKIFVLRLLQNKSEHLNQETMFCMRSKDVLLRCP